MNFNSKLATNPSVLMKSTKRSTPKQRKRDTHVSDDIKHDIMSSNILKIRRNFKGPSCKRDKRFSERCWLFPSFGIWRWVPTFRKSNAVFFRMDYEHFGNSVQNDTEREVPDDGSSFYITHIFMSESGNLSLCAVQIQTMQELLWSYEWNVATLLF
jgi:hypothetical protein